MAFDDSEHLRSLVDALTAHFGDRALMIAERQMALATGEPHVTQVWHQIVTHIRLRTQNP